MKIKRADGTVVDRKGQLTTADPPWRKPSIPQDIPEIVDGYIGLVAKLVHEFGQKDADSLKPADVKNIIALGRSVAMLQVIEVNKLASVGNRAIKDMTTDELRALTAGDAEYEELPHEHTSNDDE